MSNSQLISGEWLSPNFTYGNFRKTGITPHFMDAYWTAKRCCEEFASPARRASSNYTIGYEGEIWLCVPEQYRSWCTGSYENDVKNVTIECANLKDSSLTSATWAALVNLCADICRRNGFKLNYTGSKNGNLTMHKWYQDTNCPGPWLSGQFERLAKEVNSKLNIVPSNPTNDFGGKYICNVNGLRVRTQPNLNGEVVAYYNRGMTVELEDFYIISNGYVWGRYIGASSGAYRYIAVGRATGKPENDDFLTKI